MRTLQSGPVLRWPSSLHGANVGNLRVSPISAHTISTMNISCQAGLCGSDQNPTAVIVQDDSTKSRHPPIAHIFRASEILFPALAWSIPCSVCRIPCAVWTNSLLARPGKSPQKSRICAGFHKLYHPKMRTNLLNSLLIPC